MSYVTYTVKTNFGCSGKTEYGPTSNSLVDRITLPDGTFYQFHYEPTPGFSGDVTGRLASVTLPTLGTISYTYTGGSSGHITCTDGSTPGLTRATPNGTWTYARTAGTGAAYTTTVTDPQSNVTQIQFQGIYETQRQVNQGSSTLLQTTNTCYNASASPCTATAIALPISQVDVYVQPAGASNLVAKHTTKYNTTYGMVTEQDDYDYSASPPGTLLQKTAITYASLGNNLVAFPQLVTVTSGGSIVSQTQYNYDAGHCHHLRHAAAYIHHRLARQSDQRKLLHQRHDFPDQQLHLLRYWQCPAGNGRERRPNHIYLWKLW